jgi:hypothetical protein
MARSVCALTSGPVESHQAKTSLEMVLPTIGDSCTARQLEIFDGEQWYKQSGRLKPTHQILAAWVEKLDDALRSGFTGLRVTGNTALIENRDWGKFIEYESSINKVIPELRIKALCSYSLKKCRTSELVDALNTHQSAVIKQAGVWMKIGSTAEFVDTAGQRVLHKETPQS